MPNLGWNNMTAWYGGEEGGHIGFSPVAPLTGGDAVALRNLLRGLIEERAGLDYIAANLAVSARSFAHVTLIIFDTKNEAQAKRAYETSRLLVQEAAKQGYGRVPRADIPLALNGTSRHLGSDPARRGQTPFLRL